MASCMTVTPRVYAAHDSRTHHPAVAAAVVALAFPTLILCLVTPTNTDLDSESIMVVRYACMACQSGCGTASYFTTYQAAAVHYARSAPCNQSVRGIATVVLPTGRLTWRQVAPGLRRHGLARRDAGGLCGASGSAKQVISIMKL